MAKRTSINDAEQARLVRALMDTKDWEAAKAVLPDVDPKALDKGFKDYAFKKAGLPLSQKEREAAEKYAKLDPKRKARVDAIVALGVKAGEKPPGKKEIDALYFEAPDSALDELESKLTAPKKDPLA